MLFGRGGEWQRLISEERAVQRDFHGAISGVLFDLRTKGVSPAEWVCPTLVSAPAPGHPGFHIAGDLTNSTPTLFGQSMADFAREAIETARAHSADILFSGDRVTVYDAEIAGRNDSDPLVHPVDQETAELRLVVERANGAVEPLRTLYLRRRGRIDAKDDEWFTLEKLSDRLASMPGNASDYEVVEELRSRLIENQYLLQKEFFNTLPTHNNILASPGVLTAFNINRLVNLAALMGYRQGHFEASRLMEPLARKGIAHAERANDAAFVAGARLADQVRLEFGRDYWAKHPDATVYAVAKAYKRQPGRESEDQNAVERSLWLVCPETSKSYPNRPKWVRTREPKIAAKAKREATK